MRIHSDVFVIDDLHAAAERAGERVHVEYTVHGSRKRARAFNVNLSGTSGRRQNTGRYGGPVPDTDDYAATWDEWGMFLAELFRRDPAAVVPNIYDGAEHFRWVTGGRFDNLTPLYQHGRAGHRWSRYYPNVTGVYLVAECTGDGCAATTRRMAHGHTFAEISDPRDFDDMEGV